VRSAARSFRTTSSRSCVAICVAESWPMDFARRVLDVPSRNRRRLLV
jgi:hypothetical protein